MTQEGSNYISIGFQPGVLKKISIGLAKFLTKNCDKPKTSGILEAMFNLND